MSAYNFSLAREWKKPDPRIDVVIDQYLQNAAAPQPGNFVVNYMMRSGEPRIINELRGFIGLLLRIHDLENQMDASIANAGFSEMNKNADMLEEALNMKSTTKRCIRVIDFCTEWAAKHNQKKRSTKTADLDTTDVFRNLRYNIRDTIRYSFQSNFFSFNRTMDPSCPPRWAFPDREIL